MKFVPHAIVVTIATAAPLFFQAMANGPITWATVATAFTTFLTAAVAAYEVRQLRAELARLRGAE